MLINKWFALRRHLVDKYGDDNIAHERDHIAEIFESIEARVNLSTSKSASHSSQPRTMKLFRQSRLLDMLQGSQPTDGLPDRRPVGPGLEGDEESVGAFSLRLVESLSYRRQQSLFSRYACF